MIIIMKKDKKVPNHIWIRLKEFKNTINSYRYKNKLNKLYYNETLRKAAYHHARYISKIDIKYWNKIKNNGEDYKAHEEEKYKTVTNRVHLYDKNHTSYCRENISIDTISNDDLSFNKIKEIIDGLKSSKIHDETMKDKKLNKIGCAYYINKRKVFLKYVYDIYSVQVFSS